MVVVRMPWAEAVRLMRLGKCQYVVFKTLEIVFLQSYFASVGD
jgi:hypothetical protein